MNRSISGDIAKLQTLSRAQLLRRWCELYGKPATPGMRRELMVPFLAYKLQESAYGGLKPKVRAELRRLMKPLRKNSGRDEVHIKPGTRLLRQWREEMHEVVATSGGYQYRGGVLQKFVEHSPADYWHTLVRSLLLWSQ
jgi:Protein of unknown function (DUF2924)